ncbi:glycoside hydrolase family 3 C-terminal domain-containing protein [Microlunatus panaciterrae]|uniref:Beta-glucosidase n=1 Tax=Microlunatus panaciterrae TaxID=400768 RepID=A0ABS2RIH0_9ACTN|nr:glycoside hydrolase family 3 C-terminal domain-containing protein [Microlunatus panaciterrae]MBM7798794.1 beta-glucosidase [Microlunatus panaciterrae]
MTAQLDIDNLIGQLTLEEKAALTIGSDFWHTAPIDRLGIPAIMVSDGPHGLRAQLDEADHVGLAGSVPATCFPTASGLASSWNVDLFRTVGEALGRESRKWHVAVLLGPGVNMKRSPLCGRNFEYLSEDPQLAGILATAMVHGVQSQGVGTSVKHYAANNQEEDRLRVSAEVDPRTLREIYLPAFERIVKEANPWTVMCAYNKVNGTYASEHHWLLTEVLRDEWGFDGLVVSDWGAVHDRVAALKAGLDLEMPPHRGVSDAAVVAAVQDGSLSEDVLDQGVRRVLRLVNAALPALAEETDVSNEEHHALARRAAHESAVLLKNEGGVLPLRLPSGSRLAVIGEFARTPRYQGAGSSQVTPTRLDLAVDELTAGVGSEVEVTFAAGFGVGTTENDQQLLAEAVQAADGADAVVVFLGLPAAEESEGFDRTHMDLPTNQLNLLNAVADVHDRVVVVLANGSTVRMATWEGRAKAILECWLSGQAAGGAAADLLLGVANPSGKLAETIPLRLQDNSSFLNFPGDPGVVRYGEGIFIGYRGYDKANQEVSYPFGFGLSYTTFDIGGVTAQVAGAVETGDLAVTVTASVTNTGSVAGQEVVQVYVGDPQSSVARPVRELKAFTKVALEPGESRQVELTLVERDFAFWSELHGRWALEAGEFEVAVGSSSRQLAAKVPVQLEAPRLAAPLGPMSTLHEWLADPRGRELVMAGADAATNHLLADEELIKVVGTMPMATLAAFPGMGFSDAQLEQMIQQLD